MDAVLERAQKTLARRAVLALSDTEAVGDELAHRAADVVLELRKRLIRRDAVRAHVDLSQTELGLAPRRVDAASFAGAGARRRPGRGRGRGRGLVGAVRELGVARRCAVRGQPLAVERAVRIIVGIIDDARDAPTRACADRDRERVERLWQIAERHISLALALAAGDSAPEQSAEQAEHHSAAPSARAALAKSAKSRVGLSAKSVHDARKSVVDSSHRFVLRPSS